MISALAEGVRPLAENDFGDNLGDGVAGPVGLLIIVLMAIATVLLVRNMNKRIKRLPESFPDPRDGVPTARKSDDDTADGAHDTDTPADGADTPAKATVARDDSA